MNREAQLVDLIEEAERLHGLRLFENIDRERLDRLSLASRADVVGRRLLVCGGQSGYQLGRQIIDLAKVA